MTTTARLSMHIEDLRELQRLLVALDTEVQIDMASDGWHIVTYDPSRVAMLDVHIARGAFLAYALDGPMTIGLDLERLGQIIRQAPKQGAMDMEIGEKTVTWSDGHSMRWRQRMDVAAADTPADVGHLPHSTHCHAMLVDLRRSARMAAIVDDTIRLRLADEALTLSARYGIESIQMTIPTPDAPGTATVSLPRGYWAVAVAAIPQVDVRIDLGDNMPVSLTIDTWDHHLTGRYVIAPRIEEVI